MKRRAPSPNPSELCHSTKIAVTIKQPTTSDPLAKYHYRYLGALERDLDSFNREAGLPTEVVEVLSQLYLLAQAQRQEMFLKSPLLGNVIEFLLKIPEGLVPSFYAARICTSKMERSIRGHLKTLPLENYCALKCLVLFVKAVSFSPTVLVPFESFQSETGICEAITPAPRDDRFKPILIKMFKEPSEYFPVRSNSIKKLPKFIF